MDPARGAAPQRGRGAAPLPERLSPGGPWARQRPASLWLGTQEGLVRFDGARFAIFERAGTPGLAGDEVYALCEDDSGDVWVGTSSGLSRLRGGAFERVATGGPPAESIHLIAAEGAELWAVAGHGMRRHRAGAWSAVEVPAGLPGSPGFPLAAIAPAREGGVWLARRGPAPPPPGGPCGP